MQYTLRNIPPELDRALKARARKAGKSVNQVVLEALLQVEGQQLAKRSLRNLPGSWSKKEAADLDRFIEGHRAIDEALWE
jgi:plasmid stability protein